MTESLLTGYARTAIVMRFRRRMIERRVDRQQWSLYRRWARTGRWRDDLLLALDVCMTMDDDFARLRLLVKALSTQHIIPVDSETDATIHRLLACPM